MAKHRPSLLCFDGGGVRGLSSLYLVKQLMESIDHEDPPKPCEVFDMIGGTSTGGQVFHRTSRGFFADIEYSLIAIMLGRLEMSVEECIEHYLTLSKTVFKREHYLPVKINGRVQARFRTSALEDAIKRMVTESHRVGAEGTGVETRMRTKSKTACKT